MSIKEILKNGSAGTSVVVEGWARSLRNSKQFSFLVLNDGSNVNGIQVFIPQELSNYAEVSKSGTGTSFKVTGLLKASPGAGQQLEIEAKEIEIVGTVPEDYPLQKKSTSLEFLREIAHLRGRTNTFGSVFRIRHGISFATHQFFHQQGYYYLHTPVITGSDAEGAGELFRVTTLDPMKNKAPDYSQDYFGKQTYLTVSGQLEAETYALALGKVYTFGPTFRSENSNTSRHLSEFWMIEPEVAFGDLDTVATLAKDYVQYVFRFCLDNYPEELAFLEKTYKEGLRETLEKVSTSAFTRITYTEVIDILKKAISSGHKFEFPVTGFGMDLQSEHERYLTDTHFLGPVIVTDYPQEIKAFYMKQNPDGKTVRAMDVLVPGIGELIGGSQREDDYDKLKARMEEKHLDLNTYQWYLDLRRMGGVPHAGFGLGLERLVMYITGMSNIRDVIPFPRTPKNAEF